METAGSILISGIIDGENGANGYNTAVVQLFRRYTPTQGAPTPALPNGALTYTFSTGKLTGSYFNGWSQDMPSAASGGKLFITMATARSTEATDSIAANEWATPVEYITDGANGEPGISQAPVIIYKRYATQPTDKPADGAKYYFKTVGNIKAGSLTGDLSGWSTEIPANTNGLPCWTRQATAVALATADYDEIAASEWSDPATKLVEDGAKGTSPYFADIDNEMDSVACDKDGKTTAAYSKTLGVMLWHGSEEMTLTDIVISGTTQAVTAVIARDGSNRITGITVSVAAGTSIPLTTELTITPQATGAPNDQSVHFVLNGVKPGANGQHATLYSLIPDADVITKEADGTPTFDILNFTIIKRVGTAETVITSISSFSNEGLKLYYKVGSGSEVEVTTSYMSNGGYTNVNYHDIEQLYGATDEKIEWILRKASNNQLLDKEGIGSVKDGADSTVPGPAAVEYKISLAGSVLANDPNTGKLIVSIVGRVYKVEGDTTTPYTALTKSNLYLYFEKADGSVSQVPAGDISVSDNQFTTTCQNGANYSNEVLLGVRFNIDNVIKARESIQVVKYGTNGQSITGHTGRFFYYAGDYSGVPGNYAMQETQGPYVKVTNGTAVEFWMLDFKGVEPASFPARATDAPSDQSTQWTKMSSEQQYYIARAFFGPYAHLGSFIINGDWMISQFGVLVDSSGTKTIVNANNVDTLFNRKVPYAWFEPTDPLANTAPSSGQYKFAPNFAVDGLAGKTYQNDAYIRGEVHATSGEFSGTIKAGNTTIEGNLDLTDTNNGLTVYDQDSVPRINLQPKHINDVATLANDTYIYYSLSKTQSGASSFNVTTDEQSFTLAKYENLDIDKFSVVLRSSGSSGTIYPSSNNTSLTIIITHPDGSTTTKDITTTKFDSGRYRNLTDKIRFAASVAGTYRVKIAVRNSSSWTTGQTSVYAFVNARYQTSKDTQVYIAKDGFYAHAGANKLFWAGETETQIRYGFNGIRWNDADIFGNEAMDVVADVKGEVPNAKPLWLPFYNYVPVFSLGVGTMLFTSQVIGNIGETKYGFLIDAYRNRGVCIVKRGYEDNSGNEQPSWVILPPPTFTDSDGDSVSLPYGYQITIINSTGTDIFVVPYSNSVHGAVIIDANRNNNWFAEINGVQSRDTYIYVAHNTWLSMHDTQ